MTASDASSSHDTSSSHPDADPSGTDPSGADAPHDDADAKTQEAGGESTEGGRERYKQFRRDFDHLSFEDQATFLVEAGLKTMARGIETAGRALADELGSILRRRESPEPESPGASKGDASDGPGPAEPETSQRQTPKG